MPASRADLFAKLKALGIKTSTVEHPPVFTVEEYEPVLAHLPGAHCKSLFLKDKKKALWLIVARQRRALNINRLARGIGAAHCSFAKPEVLWQILGVKPGSVSPFGLINDVDRRVCVILDAEMMTDNPLNFHPLENTATTAISPQDLRRFITTSGHGMREIDLARFAPDPAQVTK
jgi:Ala-tRNA(Pro) deacylase